MDQRQTALLWDVSEDGKIDEREFAGRVFDLYDVDSSTFIDPLEFNAWKMNR